VISDLGAERDRLGLCIVEVAHLEVDVHHRAMIDVAEPLAGRFEAVKTHV
jgi:hypothetical protein